MKGINKLKYTFLIRTYNEIKNSEVPLPLNKIQINRGTDEKKIIISTLIELDLIKQIKNISGCTKLYMVVEKRGGQNDTKKKAQKWAEENLLGLP